MTITDDTAAKLREAEAEGRKLLEQIVAGLDCVMPGPFSIKTDELFTVTAELPGADVLEETVVVADFFSEFDALHFARCSPDSIRAINAAFQAERDRSTALEAERDAEKARADAAEAALELCMVGGNHIASVLVGSLGGGFPLRYPADMDHEEALRSLRATDTYEVWRCWSAIMRARAVISRTGEPTDE